MKVGIGKQQTSERLLYSVDYVEALAVDDVLQAVVAAVSPADLTVGAPFIVDTRVRFWVSGGTSGISYRVDLTVTTAVGRIFQDEVTIRVKDL